MSGWGWLHQVCCFAEFRSFVIYNLFFVKRKFFLLLLFFNKEGGNSAVFLSMAGPSCNSSHVLVHMHTYTHIL